MIARFLCVKCGYAGDSPLHDGCDYAAVPLEITDPHTRCETIACIVFAAIDQNRASSIAQAWAAAVKAADQIEALKETR